MTRTTRPSPDRRRPQPITFRECRFCDGRLYPQTFPNARGGTSTYFRCEDCGQPDYSTLGLEAQPA